MFNQLSTFAKLVSVLSIFAMSNMAAYAAGNDSLSLTISTGKSSYSLGEPVYLSVSLQNATKQAVKVQYPNLEDGTLKIRITLPGGATLNFVPLAVVDSDGETMLSLEPGKALSDSFPIFFGGLAWSFKEPGNYNIVAVYTQNIGNKYKVQSNILNKSIVNENGPAKMVLRNDSIGMETGKFLVWQSGDHLRKGIANLQNIIDKFPKSAIATHARLTLAENLSRNFKDFSVQRVRPADCTAALKYINQMNTKKLVSRQKAQILLIQSRCLIQDRNISQTKLKLNEINALLEKNPALRGMRAQVARLNNALKKFEKQ